MHRRKSSAERFETETSAKTLVMESLLPEFWHFVMLYMHQTGGLSQQSTLSRLIGRLRNTIENPQKITFAMAVMPQSQINIILSVYVYIYIWSCHVVIKSHRCKGFWLGNNAFISANSGKKILFLGRGNPISTQLIQYENKSRKIRFILHTK